MLRTVRANVNTAHPTDPNHNARAGDLFRVDSADTFARQMIDAGYWDLVGADDAAPNWEDDGTGGGGVDVRLGTEIIPDELWTVDALHEYARARGITVPASAPKTRLLEVIHAAVR